MSGGTEGWKQALGRASGISVAVVDDHPFVCEAVKRILESDELTVTGVALDGRSGLELVRETRPDVLVIDLDLPRMTGIEVVEAVRRERLPVRVVVFSGEQTGGQIALAVEAGADAVLAKGSPSQLLTGTVRLVHAGGSFVDPELRALGGLRISSREREVLELVAQGFTAEEIADSLVLSTLTVRTHMRNARVKLDARTMPEAVAAALGNGDIANPRARAAG